MANPPRSRGQVLVYCPLYDFQRIRPTTTDLLSLVADATHWHPYQQPYPPPP